MDYDCEGILNAPSTFTSVGAQVDLGEQELYNPHTSKWTKLTSLVLRMLHQIISFTLNAQKKSNEQIIIQAMILMYVAMNQIQADTTYWLIGRLYYIKNDKFDIHFGMTVTFIVLNLGINLDD